MIFYLFLDGVGLGTYNPETNPFARFAQGFFHPMGGKPIEDSNLSPLASLIHYIPTDAHMGISGFPQSATGQTAIWTGLNGAKLLGRHVSGFPTITLRKMIQEHSILKILKENGKLGDFLNCFSPQYLEHVRTKPKLVSASTLVQLASGRPLKDLENLRTGDGLYMDLTHEILRDVAKDYFDSNSSIMQIQNPYQVGKSLRSRFSKYDLCIYEYFITDKIGHAMDWQMAEKVIVSLELFFQGILENWDLENDLLIVTSDHGNLEDLGQKNHTENKVATVVFGKNSHRFTDRVKSLSDIVPIIYECLGLEEETEKLKKSEFFV